MNFPKLLIVLAGGSASTALALSPSDAPVLTEVVVTATAAPVSLTTPSIQAAQAILNTTTAGGAEVIDAEGYKRGRAVNLRDALDYAPGVFIQPRFGAEESRLSIRGSGLQRTFHGRGIMLLQDGVPLNLGDGSFDFQGIEPLSARYIEVYRGANALEYGSTTLGGAINIVSQTGLEASPLTLRLTYGSFDTVQMHASGGWAQGPSDGYVSFTRYSTNGFREHSQQETWRLFSNIGYRISPSLETRFYFTAIQTNSELPGNLSKEELEQDPRQAQRNAMMPRFDNILSNWHRNFTLWRVANKTTYERDDHHLTLSTYWSQKELDHPILYVIDQFGNDLGLNLRYDYTGDVADHRNRFTLGIQPTYGQLQDDRYANVFGIRGAKLNGENRSAANVTLYGEDQFYLHPAFSVIVGSQVSYAQRKNVTTMPTVIDRGDTQDWWGFSPKLGMLWDVTKSAQLFMNVSRSFEPPSFGELTAPALGGAGLTTLNAQTATTVEVGTRGTAGRFHWDLALYRSWIDDELLEYELVPGVSQTVNAGRTIHQGVEAALEIALLDRLFFPVSEGKPGDRLTLRQIYLLNDFHFDGDATFGDNRLPGIPMHYYRMELTYEHGCGFYAGPNVEWVPQKYAVDSAETLFADPYALLGFKIGYRSKRGFSVFFEGRNLTDKRYAATTGAVSRASSPQQALFLPGDGRSFYGGIEWRW